MQRTKEQVLQLVEENLSALHRLGVRRLGLFGSCARGEAMSTSDLDCVVEFDRKSFDAYMDLKFFLQDLFHCFVDLVLADTIKPRLRPIIEGETVHAERFE